MEMQAVRSKKYVRKNPPPKFEITPDDEEIITEICRRKMIDTHQLSLLFPHRSHQVISRRCKKFFHSGFVARPEAQEELHRKVSGSRPIIMSPDIEGVQLHSSKHRDPVTIPKWVETNKPVSWGHIKQHLTTTDTLIKYELASAKQKDLYFTHRHDLLESLAPEKTQQSAKPLKISTHVKWHKHKHKVSTQPDDYFGLLGKNNDFFFLESDEGTETICPGEKRQKPFYFFNNTSILQKLVVYANAFRNEIHQKRLGIDSFRVIFVTSTPQRTQQIISRCYPYICEGAHKVEAGLFLITDRETIDAHQGDTFALPHYTLAGDPVYLSDLPPIIAENTDARSIKNRHS